MRTVLRERIHRFIRSNGTSEAFDDLAVALHVWQHAHDPVVAALGPLATEVGAIPAVPVGLFRDLRVGTVTPDEAQVSFETSGTSQGSSGVHRMRDTQTYDLGCQTWAQQFLPKTQSTLALMADNPHSSLAHMVRGFEPSTGPVTFCPDITTIVVPELPIFICSTAFALDAWLSTDPSLPLGSAILTTGGFKGREHERDAETLIAAAQRVAPVVLEYGMTELSSQLWARPGEPYAPPPWLRVTAVDPRTGEATNGDGQLRFLDLCNLDSTVHIETLDHGRVLDDGRVVLHGRLPDAPVRGCSLADEHLL